MPSQEEATQTAYWIRIGILHCLTGRSHGSAEILNSSVRNELQMPKSMMRVFISAANLILIEMMLGEEGETSLLVHNRSTAEYFITRSPLCGKSLRPTKV